ncbi:MAG TPA: hypothetical protein VK919_05975 [Solirubrobacterales bacterium]|nr:hypothetical protein [Solirubrobacterales bacterium]
MTGTISPGPRARLLAGLAGAVLVGALLAIAGPAPADAAKTVEMKGGGKNLRFVAPKSVRKGKALRVVNQTNPERVGPHTFTLVSKKVMPTTRRQQNKCFDGPKRVCFRAAVAHEVDFETFEVGRPLVEAGRPGWDRSFTKTRIGDSWYTETEDEALSQKVSAKRGKTLRFLCIVHPFMQGKIEVR